LVAFPAALAAWAIEAFRPVMTLQLVLPRGSWAQREKEMTWGNRTSVLALAAAAGLAMSGWSLEAKAADLGGNCCADLEERIADLEATTARKGNRKVSLEISGQVDKALMAWNDGKDSDLYIVDNYQSTSRLRFKGTASMMPGWKAGFYIEYEFRDGFSAGTDQFDSMAKGLEGGAAVAATTTTFGTALRLRQSNAFIDTEKFGRVTVGLQSPAYKDIMNINLGGSIGQDPENNFLGGMYIRDKNLGANAGDATKGWLPNSSRLRERFLVNDLDTTRIEAIRYDTPSIYGFILSTAFGGNDYWDAALRYQKEWNSFRVAAGIGYAWVSGRIGDNQSPDGAKGVEFLDSGNQFYASCFGANYNRCATTKSELITGSASIIHIPTGLYATMAAGTRHLQNVPTTGVVNPKDAVYYYGQLGITKRFFEPGATTFYGEYGNYADFGVNAQYITGATISSSEANRYGVGVVQAFESAALELYTMYQHYSFDVSTKTVASDRPVARTPEDADVVVSGMRIKF
jgi:predicted porin